MRITQILRAQHIGFGFKKAWIFQRVRRPVDTKCEEVLKEKGFAVIEANKYIQDLELKERIKGRNFDIQVVGYYDKEIPKDENHPEYREKPCLLMENNNVLLEGLPQAQIITKTHVHMNKLPENIEKAAQIEHPCEIHEQVKKILLHSNVFDCEQKKLPKIKDPERPAFNFPRILGITDARRNILMTTKMLNLLEKYNDTSKHMHISRDVPCTASFTKDDDFFQIRIDSDALITSEKRLPPLDVKYHDTVNESLPSLHPMSHRISLAIENFYDMKDVYPIKNKSSKWYNPHTTIIHHNHTKLANLHGSKVTERQLWGRSLMHAFTVTSAFAKSLYGDDVKLLPEPVTIQCIQTDGCNYYLGSFQLNNLDVNGVDGVKNLWYQAPAMRMFDNCQYLNAKPYLEGYNSKVYNYLAAMYANI